jgi:hypothetical protein
MAKLGSNVKLRVPASRRSALRAVMVEVFGGTVAISDERIEVYDLEGSRIGAEVIDDDEALSPSEAKDKGTWLELVVPDPATTRASLAKVGVLPFQYVDEANDYYQLPGGQVVRVAPRG